MSIKNYVDTIAPAPKWLADIQADSKLRGTDKLSMRQIDAEIAKIRRRNSDKDLRQRLAQGTVANKDLNLEMTKEWFPLDQEAWDQLPE